MVQSISPPFRPHYPWLQGEELVAAELNAAIANSASVGTTGTYSLFDFGGQSDGVTDDAGALHAAIASILTRDTGGKLIIPAGRTVIGSAIVIDVPSWAALTIEGMGPEASELYFSNPTNGLDFTLFNSGSDWGLVNLIGFSVTRGPTGTPAASTGISITGDPTGGNYKYMCTLRDLLVQGNSARTTQWQNCVVLKGIGSVCDNVHILAPDGRPSDSGDVLMTIVGIKGTADVNGPAHFATGNHISNCVFQGGSTGLFCGDFVQGVFITNSNIIGNYDGIRCTSTPPPVPPATLPPAGQSVAIQINNCTFASGHRCVFLSDWSYNSIANNTLQKFQGAASTGYAGIEVVASDNFTSITGNGVTGTGLPLSDPTETGIIIADCSSAAVTGNTISASISGTSIWLKGTTVMTTVVGNVCHGAGADVQQDPLTDNNFVFGNTHFSTPIFSSFAIGGPSGAGHAIGFGSTDSPTNKPMRWFVGTTPDPEGPDGSNAGTNFRIIPLDDNQTGSIGYPFTITRATGQIILAMLQHSSFAYANDAAAAGGGVPIGGLYRSGSAVMIRVT